MRKSGNKKYNRNPLNIPINLPIPESFGEDTKEYLKQMESRSVLGYNVKNENGQNIPIRFSKDGKLQKYEKGNWSDVITQKVETTQETYNIVRAETASTGGSTGQDIRLDKLIGTKIAPLRRFEIDDVIYYVVPSQFMPLVAGENISFADSNDDTGRMLISAVDTTYTAGSNITISSDNVISATGGGAEYTAGDNITIDNNVISAVDTTYTGDGDTIDIDSNNVISYIGQSSTYYADSPLEMNNNHISLPTVTSADNGKILKVVNGQWALVMGGEEEMNASDWIPAEFSINSGGTTAWQISADRKVATNITATPIFYYNLGDNVDRTMSGNMMLTSDNIKNYYFENDYVYEDGECYITNQPNPNDRLYISFKIPQILITWGVCEYRIEMKTVGTNTFEFRAYMRLFKTPTQPTPPTPEQWTDGHPQEPYSPVTVQGNTLVFPTTATMSNLKLFVSASYTPTPITLTNEWQELINDNNSYYTIAGAIPPTADGAGAFSVPTTAEKIRVKYNDHTVYLQYQ